MTLERDKQLCEKYPEIFRDRHAPMSQTAMCWGFTCGDGWFTLIDNLCHFLMRDVRQAQQRVETWTQFYDAEKLAASEAELETATQQIPIAIQVKEKFGQLRFYVHDGTLEQHAAIDFAEQLSASVCEECGAMAGVTLETEGWWKARCQTCKDK